MAVAIDYSRAEPVFGKPTALFADEYDFGQGISIANYDVTPDGRFIMVRRSANGGRLRALNPSGASIRAVDAATARAGLSGAP